MGSEKLTYTTQETDQRIEDSIKRKSEDQLRAELSENMRVSSELSARTVDLHAELDQLSAQSSILSARRQALIEELRTRSHP